MATTIRMPEVLANVTEAAVQKWLVAPGDAIAVGQPFAEIETEKAVVEYTAETAGTVLELLIKEGDNVDVGAPIAIVGEAGEVAPASPAAELAANAAEPDTAGPAEGEVEEQAVAEAPQPPALADTGEESAEEGSSEASSESTGRRFISPLVRRLAREHELDLSTVRGSGPDGRIVRADITALLSGERPSASVSAPKANAATTVATAPSTTAEPELIPHSRMRRTIARRLTESKSTVPHFYLTAECRVDRLLALRAEINAIDGVKISVNDLVVKAVAAAFGDVPEANTTWSDEGRLRHRTADIAIAVSLDDGLVTPVVRGVESLTVTALNAAITDLAARARAGALKQHEIEGGSFAVSNLGMFGTQEFSAIINPPHAGILAVGAARQAPVVVDGALEVGTVMTVTLSADHRVMDGALAARWLAAFVTRIENPVSILA
ncbi:MAG: 2-oxo acid dehydrogenase subunit E2 [Microcella sp.]|uniref:dihydrolipoamide acetyltransferase family protein n=1 Tax=Microcella sp. TaxID=1913979 RepID=UPI0024CA2B68|nr:dihydrolipoamide acetyltransferase family protein [Microcella sp.]UYN82658.1 MAG: 2-oxo acid dehydrogenase subunit E2 [Microcella sp.]